MTKPIPDGWHNVTPRLVVHDNARLVEFLKQAFGATGDFHTDTPSIIRIGDSIVMVSGVGPRDAMPAFLYLYVDDIDATYQRALEAGALSLEAPQDLTYGDRRGMVEDPCGNVWQIATHNGAVRETPIQKEQSEGTMKDLSIALENRPGALAEMGETLGRAGVSVEGGGAFVVNGQGVAHFLFKDGTAARRALEAAGIHVLEERDVLVQRLKQAEPGQLGKISRRMAEAGVNIEVLYSDHNHQLILVVDDFEKGRVVSEGWMRE